MRQHAQVGARLVRRSNYVVAVYCGVSLVGAKHTGDDAQGCGLAGTVRPKQTSNFAALGSERYILYCLDLAERL